jgi:hypothetical protein
VRPACRYQTITGEERELTGPVELHDVRGFLVQVGRRPVSHRSRCIVGWIAPGSGCNYHIDPSVGFSPRPTGMESVERGEDCSVKPGVSPDKVEELPSEP